MHRRHFIRITGTSLGVLLMKDSFAGASAPVLINTPSKVLVTLDDGVHTLSKYAKHIYTYKNITVDLKFTDDLLKIYVQCPGVALHNVQLQWNYNNNQAAATILGDHWERSYGDLSFAQPDAHKKLPWYFIQHNGSTATCFGVKTGCNTFCYWTVSSNSVTLTMDTRNGGSGVLLDDRLLHAADVVTTVSKEGESVYDAGRRFCSVMCDAPRLSKQPVYGINDWYFAYGKNSYDLIMQHTNLLSPLASDSSNRPFSVIDAGWASYSSVLPNDDSFSSDYSKPNDKFKDMHLMAEAIKDAGMRPGLWTRPLCAAYEDPDNLKLPLIPGRDDPRYPILDPTIEENLQRIHHNIAVYKEWGYDLVKHDYSTYDIFGKWGFQMTDDMTSKGWHFNDQSKTNAEVILQLYKTIRDAAADMYLIGCNTVSHLSAGLFELDRTGDDTSGKEWARTKKMGVNTVAFRSIQHNTFYSADGDCVGLTKDVAWSKNKQWMQLLAFGGTPLFISAQPDAVGQEQKDFIRTCFAIAAKPLPPPEPLDWLTNPFPSQWKLNNEVVTFQWD